MTDHALNLCLSRISVGILAGCCMQTVLAQSSEFDSQNTKPLVTAAAGDYFDSDILKQRGLSGSLAGRFLKAGQFPGGDLFVDFVVNGQRAGRRLATFDHDGHLCLSSTLATDLGLKVSATLDAASPSCSDISVVVPGAKARLSPGTGLVEVTVPPDQLLDKATLQKVTRGGTGVLYNYQFFNSLYQNRNGSSYNYQVLNSEFGLNTDDWLIRGNHSYDSAAGGQKSRFLDAYAQKTFFDDSKIIQLGRISTRNSLFGGLLIDGAQFFPETVSVNPILKPGSGLFSGEAKTRAKVEVYQAGSLVFSTVVPPGRFNLDPTVMRLQNADAQVKVIEESGASTEFVIPAISLFLDRSSGRYDIAGLAVSAGRIVNRFAAATAANQTVVASASYGFALADNISLGYGGQVAPGFVTTGITASYRPHPIFSTGAQIIASRDSKHDLSGATTSVSASWLAREDFSLGVAVGAQSPNFRGISSEQNVVVVQNSRTTHQIGLDARWSPGNSLGTFAGSMARDTSTQGTSRNRYTVSWGVNIKNVGISLSYFQTTGSGTDYGRNKSVNLLVSMPLGQDQNVSARASISGDRSNYATDFSQRVNDQFGYQLSATRDRDGSNTRHLEGVSVSALPYYAHVGASVNFGQDYRTLGASVSGGVMGSATGMVFSPRRIRDTFGTVSVPGVDGLRINTPDGPVWTNSAGNASIASISPYLEQTVIVPARDVPGDLEVDRGVAIVKVARGSVTAVTLSARRVNRVLLTTSLQGGAAVGSGSELVDAGNLLVGITDARGRVLINQYTQDASFSLVAPDGKKCLLSAVKLDNVPGKYFVEGTAQCQ